MSSFLTKAGDLLGRPSFTLYQAPYVAAEGVARFLPLFIIFGGAANTMEGVFRILKLGAEKTWFIGDGLEMLEDKIRNFEKISMEEKNSIEEKKPTNTQKFVTDFFDTVRPLRSKEKNYHKQPKLTQLFHACILVGKGVGLGIAGLALYRVMDGNLIVNTPPIYNLITKTIFGLKITA